jgi:hypothetical protein
MKNFLYIVVSIILLATACSRKKHDKNKTGERIEIIPFYQNIVSLKDLHQIDTNLFLVEPEEFLDEPAFEIFKNSVLAIAKNPGSKVFYDSPRGTKPIPYAELKERFTQCDSVVQVDSLDNPIGKPMWYCDSITVLNSIQRIIFFESWYHNTKTNLIEKETMGYSVWQYVEDKAAYRLLFTVFRDEKSLEKAKKYYFF